MSPSSSSSRRTITEQTPLINTTNANNNNLSSTLADAAIARTLTEEELRNERNKGTAVVDAEAWDPYAGGYSHRDDALRYGAWRGPNGEVSVYRGRGGDGGIPPDVAESVALEICLWTFLILFLLAIIIVPFFF